MMKRLALLFFLFASAVYGQGVRFSSTVTQQGTIGTATNAVVLPSGATIAFCNHPANAVPCTNKATTYQDQTLAVACNTSTQLVLDGTSTCVALPDAQNNWGVWVAPNSAGYDYTITLPGGVNRGPFNVLSQTNNLSGLASPSILNVTGASTLTSLTTSGDSLFASGRPWIDVMAKGAKNDNSTDDTAAIQSAITAACAFSPTGSIVYFPRGLGYKTANTSTTPFIIPASCNGIIFKGAGWSTSDTPEPVSMIFGAGLTAPMFLISSAINGIRFEDLGLSGNPSSATAVGISVTANTSGVINHVFFDQWGGSAVSITSLFGWWITESWAQNCLEVRPASTDTGCFDLSNNDNVLRGNFVTPSVPTTAGNIGTGHTYAYAIRGSNGFYLHNMGEISQHGWLITGNYNTFVGNRSFLAQGNGFHVQGQDNIFVGNKAINSSQTATGSFDGFVIDSLGVGNTFSDNLIDDPAGNGNHTRNGFSDSNGNGAGYTLANKYSNNSFGNVGIPTGVLYNMTGSSPFAIQQPHRATGFLGDVSVTIQAGVDAETQVFNTVLTANRTVTLSTTGAWQGARFRIIRTSGATGAFNLTIVGGPGAVLLPGEFVDVEFSGAQWNYVAGGTTDGTYRAGTLIPQISGTTDIGSATNAFVNLWLGTASTNNFKFQPAATAAARTVAMPDPGTNVNLAFNLTATSAAFATATTAGTCVQNTTAVTGATTSMAVLVSPVSTPGVGAVWSAFVSSAGNVTINECAVATSAGGTIAFNIRVTP